MSRYYIDQDLDRCIGCRSCEVHCKTEHDMPVGPRLCEIVEVGPRLVKGVPRINFIFMPCFHCEQPWCVAACPTGAMQRRESDGLVTLDTSLCVGCKACISACPWGVPQWNSSTGTVYKCDYCQERLERGQEPACVSGCTTKALRWVDPLEAGKRKRAQYAHDISEHLAK